MQFTKSKIIFESSFLPPSLPSSHFPSIPHSSFLCISVPFLSISPSSSLSCSHPTLPFSLPQTGRCGDQVTEVGDVIFTLNATDADTGLSGTVVFPPLQDTNLPFDLSVAGVITISAPLDYELEQEYTVSSEVRV